MKKLLGLLILTALIALLAWYLKDPFYSARLIFMEPPSGLPVPVTGVHPRKLSDTWNAPRSEGRQHQGIDIFAARGTPVSSTTNGIVWKVGANRLGGNAVWILGPGGQIHYYAHLDRFAEISAGNRVRVGDILGFVGTTGNAIGTPPHLHYGIYTMGGQPINPYPLLSPGLFPEPAAKSAVSGT